MPEVKPIGSADPLSRRARAALYFTLQELTGKYSPTAPWWASIDHEAHTDLPLGQLASQIAGRLDLDSAGIIIRHQSIQKGLEALPDESILELGKPGYPKLLAQSGDGPQFLFVHDRARILDLPALAIVGTRHPSDDGRRRARKLAHLLVKRGIVVTSGLAVGIDEAAHLGALELGGLTVAVLGTPLTHCYPAEHAALQKRIGALGALVSQYRPGATIGRWSFPMRNAVMSGLSIGTVVIEASETSGALIQARKSLAQGRPLFIPQSALENPHLRWPRKYVALGANVFSNIDDLMQVLEQKNLVPSETVHIETDEVELVRVNAGRG